MKTSFINKTIIILVCISLVVCSFPMTVHANKSSVLDDLIDTMDCRSLIFYRFNLEG